MTVLTLRPLPRLISTNSLVISIHSLVTYKKNSCDFHRFSLYKGRMGPTVLTLEVFLLICLAKEAFSVTRPAEEEEVTLGTKLFPQHELSFEQ